MIEFLPKKYFIVLICFVFLVFSFFQIQRTKAASLLEARDVISSSVPGAQSMHTISFKPQTDIPANGKIIIKFEGLLDTGASPSATTFALNTLSLEEIVSNNASCNFSISTNQNASLTITCTLSASVEEETSITIIIGCKEQVDGICTSESPKLLNPSKSISESADIWKVNISTQDDDENELDFIIVRMSVIEGTLVSASVEETFTFEINGIGASLPVNSGNSVGCLNNQVISQDIESNSTSINLGKLSNTPSSTDTQIKNIASQLLTVKTNSPNGYSLTATASSSLKNEIGGYEIAFSSSPSAFLKSSQFFGIHPCGTDTDKAVWQEIPNSACENVISQSEANECRYAWPAKDGQLTLVSVPKGPIGDSVTPGNGLVSLQYAAGIDNDVPGGDYKTVITFTAMPVF